MKILAKRIKTEIYINKIIFAFDKTFVKYIKNFNLTAGNLL